MNETVKIWLENFINKEIKDVIDNIENRKTWCNGISDKETLQTQHFLPLIFLLIVVDTVKRK